MCGQGIEAVIVQMQCFQAGKTDYLGRKRGDLRILDMQSLQLRQLPDFRRQGRDISPADIEFFHIAE